MKKHALNPNPTEPPVAIAVSSLTPALGLLCLQPTNGYPAGSILPVYGGNHYEGSVYVPGTTPKDWRLANEEGDYGHEVLFRPLPELMEEIVLSENPGQYELVVTECRVIPMPAFQAPEAPMCKVIQHPATFTAQRVEKPASKRKPTNPKQYTLPLYEDDVQPVTQIA